MQRLERRGAGAVMLLTQAAFLSLPLAGSALAVPSRDAELKAPITYEAASGEIDYKNKVGDFKDVIVSQGLTRITADRAHAVGLDDFQDGRWTFRGNVHINAEPRGTLRSDEAVVEFRDKLLTTATATGKPAEFQQNRGTGGELARGHADLIVYDVKAGTVTLTRDAWVTFNGNQFSAPEIVYNIKEQRVLSDAGKGGRVHATIVPQSSQSSASATPGKAEKPK
jgi:lipopolysaccharide export system protein LptA